MKKCGCGVVKDVARGLKEKLVPELGTLTPKSILQNKDLGGVNLEDTTDALVLAVAS